MKSLEKQFGGAVQESAHSKEKILSPEELRIAIEAIGNEEEQLAAGLGIAPAIFPEGTMIGEMDIGGKTMAKVLAELKGFDAYEPPIGKEQEPTVEQSREIPAWLSGHEELVWRGAHDNPLWKPVAEQYKDYVKIGFSRREIKLYSGKTKESQEKELAPVKNTFTLDEWKILKMVFDEYLSSEEQMRSINLEERRKAKNKILEIAREENAYRKGKQELPPKIITDKIKEALEQVAKTTRGFDKSKINTPALSQETAEILSQLLILNRTRGDGKEHLLSEKKMSGIKEYPSFEHTLKNLANSLSEQLRQGQGISYMIGEAGTGKNIATEYFALRTNRPFFWFPCGRGMESMDLVCHYEFDSNEGTRRFLTDLAKGIQTPGAILLIDEVNALKPQVQALLHGLGDKNRSLNYDAVNIPMAEGVLVVIASNPATYGSAGNLGESLLNRTRGLAFTVDYPALHKGELRAIEEKWSKNKLTEEEQKDNSLREYASDEVLVLFEILPGFNDLPKDKFKILWDTIINEHNENLAILEKDPVFADLLGKNRQETIKTLKNIKNIIEIGDTWRKYYGEKKSGFDIVGFSIRDSLAVVNKYTQTRNVRRAFLDVYDDFRKNPIDGLDAQYLALENLLNQRLGND